MTELDCDSRESWRLEQLLEVGYADGDAHLLAANPEVDLHVALDLLTAGCPAELALKILLSQPHTRVRCGVASAW